MKLIEQFLAITEAELKNNIRQLGDLALLFIFPFMLSTLFYGIGSSFQGSSASLEIWVYQIVGFTVFFMSIVMSQSSVTYIRQGLLTGRLEYVFLSPVRVITIILATAVATGIFLIIYYTGVGVLAFILIAKIDKLIYFLLSIPVITITLMPALGINLFLAALSIIVKEPEPLLNTIAPFIGTVSGLIYPIALLPPLLQVIGKSLPYFYAAEYARAMIEGYLDLIFANPFPFLFMYLIAGIITYNYMDKKYIKKRGYYGW